jgi:hypothetical protein
LPTQYLKGAQSRSTRRPQYKWAIKAPGIAGLIYQPTSVRLLTEGIAADGRMPDPSIPRYRLTRSDAEAVVSYLKSLK